MRSIIGFLQDQGIYMTTKVVCTPTKMVWEKPEVKDLGKAKDIIQDVNITGSGDSIFSVLNPS